MDKGSFSLEQFLHELKTPLMSLTLVLDELEHDKSDELIEIAKNSAKHIDSLLQQAKSNLNNSLYNKIYLNQEIKQVTSILSPIAKNKGIELKFGEELNLDVERDTLFKAVDFRQVLINLIGNALKYAPENSRVLIKLSEKNELSIENKGYKISDYEQGQVLRGGVRLSNSINVEGSGLGLKLTSQILSKYGSELKFDSDYDGVKVYFVLS
jgi:signal transduction histidine kinase